MLIFISILQLFLFPINNNRGTVHYTETLELKIELPPELAHMADKMPSEKNTDYLLEFTPEATLYGHAPKAAEVAEQFLESEDSDKPRVLFASGNGKNDCRFRDLKAGTQTQQVTFFGRTFLIEEPIEEAPKWKVTGEQRDILGYRCLRATTVQDSSKISAWFAPEIPSSIGPNGTGGLPGLILQMHYPDQQRTIRATQIELGTVDASRLVPPTEGKSVSREKFNKIRQERLEEMGMETSGKRGTMKIEVRRF